MNKLPDAFIKMLHHLMGDEASDLIESLDQPSITSIRINKRKPCLEFDNLTPVPWCESGFYLNCRPEFILDPLLHAGAYYVQDASSMIYETVISKLLLTYPELKRAGDNLSILDLCAAPGGKTTAIINALADGCIVTANEYSKKRFEILKENLTKWGYPLVNLTNQDSSFFASQGENFDIVAVDAPCSGEGMMRKEEMARTQWTEKLVEQCAVLQKDILKNAVDSLKPGGFLIYSTCTFNKKENEENAEYIANELGLFPVNLKFPQEWKIPGGYDTDLPVYRFMPHKTKGEGLFLAVFQKPGELIFNFKKKIKKDAILNLHYDPSAPRIEVDKNTALKYLRRESIRLPENAPLGIVTITYKDLPLGQAKNIGNRANNLYPKNWRILKQ